MISHVEDSVMVSYATYFGKDSAFTMIWPRLKDWEEENTAAGSKHSWGE